MYVILKENMILIIATALIFLSGVGIGAALTEMIIDKEENDEETETDTTETIRGQYDTSGS